MAKQILINFKADEDFRDELHAFSDAIDIPASQYIREAVKERNEKIKKRFPHLRETKNAEPRELAAA